MKTRTLGILALTVIFTTAVWVALMVYNGATAPEFHTLADRVLFVQDHFALFIIGYLNAGLITGFTIAMMAGLYAYFQSENPLWAVIAFVFVPIYGLINLVVYFSQLFVVPQLLALYKDPAMTGIVEVLLAQAIHDWPGSAAGFVNVLAYTALGVSSIIFGCLLLRGGMVLRIGGLLLAVSGVLSMMAFVGVAIGSAALSGASILSGVVFMVALIFLAVVFFQMPPRLEVR